MDAPTKGVSSSLATEQIKGWNKTRSSSEAKFLFSFVFNLELYLVVKSASLTALKHEARTAQALARQAACLLVALPIQYIIEECKIEIQMFFLQVFDTDSFSPPAFLHLRSSENDKK